MSSTIFYNSQNLVGIGSVGIGTTSPFALLDISGQTSGPSVRMSSGGNSFIMYPYNTGAGYFVLFSQPSDFIATTFASISIGVQDTNNGIRMAGGGVTLYGGSQFMAVTNIGVGIGAASPTANLYVVGNVYASNALQTPNILATTANITTLNVTGAVTFSNLTASLANVTTLNVTSLETVSNLTASLANVTTLNVTSLGTISNLNVTGNVGIGVMSPSAQLHLNGKGQATITAFSTTGNLGGSIILQDSGASAYNGGALVFGASQGYFAAIKGAIQDGTTNTTGDLYFATRNASTDASLTTRMTITSAGNVGIGTNPTQLLELYSSASAGSHSTLFTGNRLPKIGGGNGKNFLQIQCQDATTPALGSNITFFTDATNFGPSIEYCSSFHTFLNSSGTAPNVGIGTASPQNTLHVQGSTLVTNPTIYNSVSGGWYNIGLWDCTAFQNSGAHLKVKLMGCTGYQGGYVSGTQAGGESTIYLTNLNNVSTATVNVDGWWKHEGGNVPFTSVKVVQNGTSRFQYYIWVNITGGFTEHSINAETTGGTIWTTTFTSGSDPGANSATVQLIVLNTAAVGTNVGIGTTSPVSPLTVYGTDYYTGGITLSTVATGASAASEYMIQRGPSSSGIGGTNWNTSNVMLFHNSNETTVTTGATGFLWASSGQRLAMFYDTKNSRLGIGTTNPMTGLHCFNSSSFSLLLDNGTNSTLIQQASSSGGLYIRTGTGTSGGSNGLLLTSGGGFFGPNSDNATALGGVSNRWTSVYAMTIISYNQVGIGIANPGSPLSVYNNGTSGSTTCYIDSGTAGSGDCVYINKKYSGNFVMRLDTVATYPANYIYFAGPTMNPGAITATNATSMAYGTGSDYRIKSNVVPLSNSIDFINKLNPIYFTFNVEPTEVVAGFLAHEIQEVIPSAVSGEKDAVDASGNMVIQHLDNSFIIPYLTAAVQELSAKNAALEQSLSSLEARLAALEAK